MYSTQPWTSQVPVQKSRMKRRIVRTRASSTSFVKSSHRSTADAERVTDTGNELLTRGKLNMLNVFILGQSAILRMETNLICCTDVAVQKSLGTCSHYSLFRFQKQLRTDRYCLNIVTKPTKGKLGVFLCDQRPTQDQVKSKTKKQLPVPAAMRTAQ